MTTETIFKPRAAKRSSTATYRVSGMSTGLPEDLLRAAVKRLRVLALLYAFVFFSSNLLGQVIDPETRSQLFEEFANWGPASISIVIALVVAGLTMSSKVSPKAMLDIGLLFQVAGSFGIAMAENWGLLAGVDVITREHRDAFGVSFVAVWMLLFTIVVPSAPRKALLAAAASVSTVLITLWLSMRYGGSPALRATDFVGLGLNYSLIVLMAYVGARVIYGLGREVGQAREMGSYRLVERLGKGGMGEVWRAEHRMLARPGAIKLVRPEVLGASDGESARVLLNRFEREAQATATLRSPHTVELYDFGIADDGTFYYVMELLDGLDLESLVKNFGPIPPERAIRLLHQVCDSLGEAHESGLIHRDIKPANVFACRYGRSVDFVKVLDFGLVKTRGERGGDELALTADGVVSGTPGYMAPEQVLGDRPIDARTDIYAVGCLAYWLLAGELVFQGTTAMEVMVHHAHSQPLPPSGRTELPIPASIDDVILSCLAKDPAERPQTTDELSQRLDACSHDVEPWTPARAARWWDTHHP